MPLEVFEGPHGRVQLVRSRAPSPCRRAAARWLSAPPASHARSQLHHRAGIRSEQRNPHRAGASSPARPRRGVQSLLAAELGAGIVDVEHARATGRGAPSMMQGEESARPPSLRLRRGSGGRRAGAVAALVPPPPLHALLRLLVMRALRPAASASPSPPAGAPVLGPAGGGAGAAVAGRQPPPDRRGRREGAPWRFSACGRELTAT